MRSRDVLLNDMRDVLLLCQYLYAKEGNYVEIPGAVPGTMFRFSMDEDMNIVSSFKPNLGTGDEKWTSPSIDSEMTVKKLSDVVENLKEMPAVQFPKAFKNRWEEVRMTAAETVALNKMNERGGISS